jgi:protein-tyrosine phosphatase
LPAFGIFLVYHVLFLCTGNYFRSRFSELWFNHCISLLALDDVCVASSAGLNVNPASGNVGPVAAEALAVLRDRGLQLDVSTLPMPRQVAEADLLLADLIIAVDAQAHRPMVRALFPEWEPRIQFWDVKDLGEDGVSADPVLQLQASVEKLIDRLVLINSTVGSWGSAPRPL